MSDSALGQGWPRPDAADVARVLATEGIIVDPHETSLLERDDRFAAFLPQGRMAWFPLNPNGRDKLAREARVLRLLAEHGHLPTPRVIRESPAGWQVRQMVPGNLDPFGTYNRIKSDIGFAAAVGRSMGTFLAGQHLRVPAKDLVSWLPLVPEWPPAHGWIARRLPRVVDDASLIARALGVIERYEDAETRVTDRVLTHNDFGFHNVIVDADTGAVSGVFDYDGAACGDRHHDFKYLLLDAADETLVRNAIDAYTTAGGSDIDHDRLALLNAASAVAFLAFRAGSAPEEKPAGRTLSEDLNWTRMALERAGQR